MSTNIIRTLQEREWIRVVGHRDVPGKPALFATTSTFLDSFGLKNLDELPTLAEIRDMENLEPELQLESPPEAVAAIPASSDEDMDLDDSPPVAQGNAQGDAQGDEQNEADNAGQDTERQ